MQRARFLAKASRGLVARPHPRSYARLPAVYNAPLASHSALYPLSVPRCYSSTNDNGPPKRNSDDKNGNKKKASSDVDTLVLLKPGTRVPDQIDELHPKHQELLRKFYGACPTHDWTKMSNEERIMTINVAVRLEATIGLEELDPVIRSPLAQKTIIRWMGSLLNTKPITSKSSFANMEKGRQEKESQSPPNPEKEKPNAEELKKMAEDYKKRAREEPGANRNQKKEPSPHMFTSGGHGSKPPWGDVGSFVLLTVAYIAYKSLVPSENHREITWQEFRTAFLEKGLVDKLVVVNGSRVKVYLHQNATSSTYPDAPASQGNIYVFSIGSIDAFERRLDIAQDELGIPGHERIPLAYKNEISWTGTILSFLPTLLVIGSIIFIARRATNAAGGGGPGGIFNVGKSRAKLINPETDIKVKFKDVAGMDEAKQEIVEFVSFLRNPERFQKLGAKIPRGAILSGPPGTGKTLLAKATAGEANVPFYSVTGSEFVEMFVGVGASRVRDLFRQAREHAPSIIFVDEIDAIGKSRQKGQFSGGNDEREATLNQLLTEMDGFSTKEQVIVLAGTNRADTLDSALMRPGRFDRHIYIDRPTMIGRKQIFLVHLGKIISSEDMDHLSGKLAALTPGFSGADIANCVNEGALVAARHGADSVTIAHFEQAIERVIAGLEKKSLVLSPEEKKTVAYHEAGHAICGWYFKYADPLLKVSIIPRGQGALGYAQYLPQGDSYLMSMNQLMDRMAMTLGGRVSEELHFESVTTGASDDFNKVTHMAKSMVTKWGMSRDIGFLHYEEDKNQLQKPYSEETGRRIDEEVKKIVENAYVKCKALLTEKKNEVGLVAEELLKKEVLVREDMIRILGKRPFGDAKEFEKYFHPPESSAPPPFPQEGNVPPQSPAPGNPESPLA